MPAADAVELSIDSAWYLADVTNAGTFPWVLAVTPPYRDGREWDAFAADQRAALTSLGIVAEGEINPTVRQWITTTCRPQRWLELRYLSSAGDMLRGIVARRAGQNVVALRHGKLITLSAVDILTPGALAAVVTAGLSGRVPASFDEFTVPVAVGARADQRLRAGAALIDVLDHLGIPESAWPVARAAVEGPRHYVEVVAGQHTGATPATTDVGIAVIDTALGRVLVSPTRAFDRQWVSVFAPGSDAAIACSVERLTHALPDGGWFATDETASSSITQRTYERT